MNRFLFILTFLIVTISCTRNAVTGRNQFKLVSNEEVQLLAASQYKQFLSSNKILSATVNEDAQMVQRVGQRLTAAITAYYTSLGKVNVLNGFNWEYNLLDSKEINAWCMPGGKIAVYSGMLSVTENEAALAVVMSHEIAHALAQHWRERISYGMVQEYGNIAQSVSLPNNPGETQSMFLNAYGIGSEFGTVLPFSHKDEFEADKYGLKFAALSGYDPKEAINLWERLEKTSSNGKHPDFLITHPWEENRLAHLKDQMPEVLKLYNPINR
jgi:predicted Zn-dependent protease